ncbi:MAG: PEP/pyruvate-binding domain-containing protein [Anaerolineae bacterium]
MSLIRPLEDITMMNVAECGGKAARLGEAMRLGCQVPRGVVLTTEVYHRFMRQGGLHGEIASILMAMQPTATAHFQAAEWAIAAAFAVRRMPEEITNAILAAWDALGRVPVAVRSSATNEDSPGLSFVGQHASVLNVSTEEGLTQAATACWLSLYSAKALSYAHHFGIDLLNSSMAILLQTMVEYTVQGILLTVDPISGNPDVFVLEELSGTTHRIHRLDPYERKPGELRTWSELRRIGLLLDEHYLAYQAVEWIINQGNVYVLHTRPVTGVPPYLPVTVSHRNAEQEPLTLVHGAHLTPRAVQPYSWYHRSRSQQLTAAYAREATPLFSTLADQEQYFMRGYLYQRAHKAQAPTDTIPAGAGARLLLGIQRIRAAGQLDRHFGALWQELRPRLDALNERDLTTLSNEELADHLEEVIEISSAFSVERGRLMNVDQALTEMLDRLHRSWLAEAPDLAALLFSTEDQRVQRDLALCRLAQQMAAQPTQEDAPFRHFFRRFRHLYLPGHPLEAQSDICDLREDEQAAREDLARHLADRGACQEQTTRAEARRAELERRVLNGLGRSRRPMYRTVLNLARRYAPLGTNCNEPIMLCCLMERDAVLEVGRRLRLEGYASSDSDACLLTYREVIDWLRKRLQRDALVRTVFQRRDYRRRWWRYAPPETLTPHRDEAESEVAVPYDPSEVLQGLAVSPGTAKGRVRVIRSLREAHTMFPGEVLVCKEPLFELSPWFGLAAALVTEKGGLLEHAAVLAREYGIPAIFGVPDATRALCTGEQVLVDANRGQVAKVREEPPWEDLL